APGIVVAQVFYCFPHALIIAVTALGLADARLYEVAEALGTKKSRIFRTVTLPGAKFGLMNAAFVVFTLVVTDFGIAKVIGGQFKVAPTAPSNRVRCRRAVQRARYRRLQAGGRAAELRDGRGGRHGAARARGARLRDRPHRAAPA